MTALTGSRVADSGVGGGWTVQALPDEKQTLAFGPLDYGPSAKK
jgi:hypothetical protein